MNHYGLLKYNLYFLCVFLKRGERLSRTYVIYASVNASCEYILLRKSVLKYSYIITIGLKTSLNKYFIDKHLSTPPLPTLFLPSPMLSGPMNLIPAILSKKMSFKCVWICQDTNVRRAEFEWLVGEYTELMTFGGN